MAQYVDLHAHYLPALDDGATDRRMSLQMVRAIASLGFSDLYATPHQRAGMFMPARTAIDAAFQTISEDVAAPASGSARRISGTTSCTSASASAASRPMAVAWPSCSR